MFYGLKYIEKTDCIKIKVEGPFFPHKEIKSDPLKHFGLRALSFLMGRHLIKFIKSKLIFKNRLSSHKLIRRIKISRNNILIEDQILNVEYTDLFRAPRSSKRHVASADCFHDEDLSLTLPFLEKRTMQDKSILITTEYSLKD